MSFLTLIPPSCHDISSVSSLSDLAHWAKSDRLLGAWAETANQWIDVDDIDQRPPEVWEAQQWAQTSPCWRETPLAQWAAEANPWDGIDSIPPEDEPVFYTD